MANAIVTERIVSVTLELSEAEAQFLLDLVGWGVIGSQENSRRRHADAIHRALNDAGFTNASRKDMSGYVEFSDA